MSGPLAEVRRFHVLLCNYPCRARHYLDSHLVDCSPCGRQDISVVFTILPPELARLPWWCSVGLCLPSLCCDHRVSVPWGQGIHVLTYFIFPQGRKYRPAVISDCNSLTSFVANISLCFYRNIKIKRAWFLVKEGLLNIFFSFIAAHEWPVSQEQTHMLQVSCLKVQIVCQSLLIHRRKGFFQRFPTAPDIYYLT